MIIKSKFDIGDELKDNVTGFKGIVMGITLYATGCLHYGLSPKKLKGDGSIGDWEWFDQSRLSLKKSKAVSFDIPEGTTSGPFPNAPEQ